MADNDVFAINGKSGLLAKHGPWVAVAIYLIWNMAQGFGGKLDKIDLKIDQHETLAAASRTTIQTQQHALDTLVLIARASCVNAAKDEPSRLRCLAQ